MLPFAVAHAETLKFHTTMDGAHEVPPHQVKGTGTVEATLDTATRMQIP